MKVVIIPGVGFQSDKRVYERFAKSIKKEFDCETEIFYWQYSSPIPEFKLPYQKLRKFAIEVMMDAQFVLLNEDKISIPDADFYIGHSAGSIIALSKSKAPCVIMGSPAALLETLRVKNIVAKSFSEGFYEKIVGKMKSGERKILNIVNEYDVLAYPLDWENVENKTFSGSRLNPLSYSPLTAHAGYWDSCWTIKTIGKTLNEWTTIRANGYNTKPK